MFLVPIDMTEKELQRRFVQAYKTASEIVIPNAKVYGWESDLLRVTKAGFVHEYDIKLDNHDLHRDGKKEWKHKKLTGNKNIPNSFTYIVSFDITSQAIAKYEEFAGVLKYHDEMAFPGFTQIRPTKLLHENRVTDDIWYKLLYQFNRQFWKTR